MWKSFQLGGRRRNRLRHAENQTLGPPWGRPFGLPGPSPRAVRSPEWDMSPDLSSLPEQTAGLPADGTRQESCLMVEATWDMSPDLSGRRDKPGLMSCLEAGT